MFPTLSVALIGLLVGVAVMLASGSKDRMTVLAALLGAWVGFGVGALFGVILDVVLTTGTWVALIGHVLALVGAAIAVRLRLARVASAAG